jgi:hypothetical protein
MKEEKWMTVKALAPPLGASGAYHPPATALFAKWKKNWAAMPCWALPGGLATGFEKLEAGCSYVRSWRVGQGEQTG